MMYEQKNTRLMGPYKLSRQSWKMIIPVLTSDYTLLFENYYTPANCILGIPLSISGGYEKEILEIEKI